MRLSFYFSILTLCVSIPVNSINILEHKTIDNWLERTTLNNKELTEFRGWFHVVIVLVISVLTIKQVQETRAEAKKAYQNYYKAMSKKRDHEWLKARTLHVKGIPPEDRSGNYLKTILESVIAPNEG